MRASVIGGGSVGGLGLKSWGKMKEEIVIAVRERVIPSGSEGVDLNPAMFDMLKGVNPFEYCICIVHCITLSEEQ